MLRIVILLSAFVFFFFFNDTATTEIYPLSLHDALPIYRLGDVGHERGHAIAGSHARCLERRRDAPCLAVQLGVAELATASGFIARHERGVRVAPPQQVLGEVEARAREPPWPLGRVGGSHATQSDPHGFPRLAPRLLGGNHPAEAPHGGPEPVGGRDRPAVQRAI